MKSSKNSERFFKHKRMVTDIKKKVKRQHLDKLPKVYELPPNITDHVVVRYLHRIKGIDIPQIAREIEAIIEPSKELGDGRYNVGDSIIVVKQGKAVTCLPRERHIS